MAQEHHGKLYIVPTPIGNLNDITLRALSVFREVDAILCEDTRHTQRLLQHYGIVTTLISYHAHSSQSKEDAIIEGIRGGKSYALVSDAGTPAISDPGAKIIARMYAEFHDEEIIIPLPGPTALIPALSASGFSGNQFTFYGFFPQKKGRKKLLEEIAQNERISVLYESPHRILKLFKMVQEYFPEMYEKRQVFVARELTKLFEEKKRGNFAEVHAYYLQHPEKVKGEFVVVIAPR